MSLLASGAAAAGHLFPDCTNGPLKNNTVCNTGASVGDRAKALVAAFTNEEKFNLVVNTSPGVPRLGLPSYEWWRKCFPGGCSWKSEPADNTLPCAQRRPFTAWRPVPVSTSTRTRL